MKVVPFVFIMFSCLVFSGEPNLVYLVRHAEKVDESRDADLSEVGLQRVAMLKQFFERVTIDRVFASQYQRTQKTVRPVAEANGLTVTIVDARTPAKIVDIINSEEGKTTLLAGHSNTVPELIRLLGGPEVTIDHEEYRDIFLMILGGDEPVLQRLRVNP